MINSVKPNDAKPTYNPLVCTIVQAVGILLGLPLMAWPECHALIGDSESLLAKMEAFNFDALNNEKVTIVAQLLNSDAFKVSKI